jgi:hypothetical protein
MRVGRDSRPLAYRQIIVLLSLATLPLAAISLTDAFVLSQTSDSSFVITLLLVCASGWLVLLFLGGVLATWSTSSVPAGAAAGLVVGLLSGLVYLVAGGALAGLLYSSQAFTFCYGGCPPPPPPTLATVGNEILGSLGIFGGIPIVVGAGCGLLGGILGLVLHWLRRSKSSSTLLR